MAMQDLNVKQCDRVKKNFIKAIGDEIDYRFFKRAIEQQKTPSTAIPIFAPNSQGDNN
jgi:hypothetical protein